MKTIKTHIHLVNRVQYCLYITMCDIFILEFHLMFNEQQTEIIWFITVMQRICMNNKEIRRKSEYYFIPAKPLSMCVLQCEHEICECYTAVSLCRCLRAMVSHLEEYRFSQYLNSHTFQH